MTTTQKHTDTPWAVWDRLNGSSVTFDSGRVLADCSSFESVAISKANAAYIVEAVNAYARLVDVLKRLDFAARRVTSMHKGPQGDAIHLLRRMLVESDQAITGRKG